tara:strand:- start:234 stop:368 length:135 start_codon:yes stop_codon:yes gene_type:complete
MNLQKETPNWPPDWPDLNMFLACVYFTTAPASDPGNAGMLFLHE